MPKRPRRTQAKSDPVRRGLRTLFQVGTVTLAIQGWNLFAGPSHQLTPEQTAWITTLGTLLVSLSQNALEEAGAVPTMLKGKTDADAVTTLTPGQMLATAEYLRDRALREEAEPSPTPRTLQIDALPRVERFRG